FPIRLDAQEHDTRWITLDELTGVLQVARHLFFFQNEMIRRQKRYHRIRIKLGNMHQSENDSESGFLVLGLNKYAAGTAASELALYIGERQVALIDHRKDARSEREFFGAIPSVFQHGTAPDKIDVLLGQEISAQEVNERTQPFAFSTGQDERARNSRFVNLGRL